MTSEDEAELRIVNEEIKDMLSLPKKTSCCKQCCCYSHCIIANHGTSLWKKANLFTNLFKESMIEDIEVSSIYSMISDDDRKVKGDSLTDLLFSVNSNFE